MKIAVMPDKQCKPGAPEDHLTWIGQYILEQKPDVIVDLGYELMQRKYPDIYEQSQWLKRETKRWEDGSS